jgi:hypothetical protein
MGQARRVWRWGGWLTGVVGVWASVVMADEEGMRLVLKDHHFRPALLVVPSGVRQLLLIDNQDDSPEEFESGGLHREKILPGHTVTRLFIGPLKPGTYDYFGDFHHELAKGSILAK